MFIDDEAALRDWLVATLEPLCDAEPIALARYVLALVTKDKPLDKLRENCVDRLEVFLDRATKDFVDQLFDVIRNRRYIPEGKKENVQPKSADSDHNTPESHVQEDAPSPTKQEDVQSNSRPTTSSTTQSNKRPHSSRRHENSNTDHHHQRPSGGSPPAKRTQRSYSRLSSDSSSPRNPDLSTEKVPCKEFFNNNGYCAAGDSCPYDHGSNTATCDQPNYYPSYEQQYDMPSSRFDQTYNPETPELKYDSPAMYNRPSLPSGQRTLVTVVTNAEPLSFEHRNRTNDSSGPVLRTKRHITTAPYPNNRRPHQPFDNRGRKRPWQKPDGTGTGFTTLEIRKIPAEFNLISKLNEHFSKFGTVTNVQIAFDGFPDSALIAYGTSGEAETAYKNPEPLFNNRFIKIFWHNPNKTPNPTNPKQPSSDKPSNPTNQHHWTKSSEVTKKKPTFPVAPSSIKKEAAKKAAIEIRRKKQDLIGEQIQQQKLLLKKLETAETNDEKESIRSLMKQVDTTIVTLQNSLQTLPPVKSTPKLSQQDLLKQRAETLKKQIESLRAKTSADMRRVISTTIENKLASQTNEDDEDRLLTDNDKTKNPPFELDTHDELELHQS